MEQKKTLWIIAAVGAFLLVVLGAACILYSPATKPGTSVASVAPVEKRPQKQNSGWSNPYGDTVREPTTLSVPESQDYSSQGSDFVVYTDNATVYSSNTQLSDGSTTIDLNALKKELYQETPAAAQPQNINITVNIPETKESTTFITTTPDYKPETNSVAEVKPVETKAVAKETTTTVKKVEKTVSTPTKTTKVTTTVEAKPATPKVTQYWVQVAAYSNKKGAEGARSILDENKIPADIFTFRDNKDRLFYRVRVGPYTTKSEAEYWRSKIIKIDDFAKAESFVTSTTN